MGLGALLARASLRVAEHRALPPGVLLTHPGGSPLPTWADPDRAGMDPDAALRLPAVLAAVRLLADSVSSLPAHLVAEDPDELGPAPGRPAPLPALLREPAAGQSLGEWLYAAMSSLLLRGNAYGLITARSGPALHPAQVELVHPDLVGVTADPVTGVPEYRIGGQPFGRHDVWHARAHVMPGVLLGLSPIELGRQAIAHGLAIEKFGASFFGTGAIPSGALLIESPDVEESEIIEAKAAWQRAQRTRTIAALTPAIRFEPLTVKPEEAQFVETAKLNVSQIARLFGVPVEMIGGDTGGSLTYSSTEARAADFVKYSLRPWLVRMETALSRLVPAGQRVRFNPDALLRGTTAERYAAHAAAIAAGWLTTDEVRAIEGLDPLPAPSAPASDPGDAP